MINDERFEEYSSKLNVRQTEKAIQLIKNFFEQQLAVELKLFRVTAPLFVASGYGINDDLDGANSPVIFKPISLGGKKLEVVQSLAKWKRLALADQKIEAGYGLYTDMNAIRPGENLDTTHSFYVDQWDWERVITIKERNLSFLKQVVNQIYGILKRLEFFIHDHYDLGFSLPEKIVFIHAEEAFKRYPQLAPQDRERELARQYGAIFVIGIGGRLADGSFHGHRAPDYDDWITPTESDFKGLNGDIILWNQVLDDCLEISSMGIRVDQQSLLKQLELTGNENRKELYYHQKVLNQELPLSIGGGIGQSRLCMQFLRKLHIGEVQAAVWDQATIEKCKKFKVALL